MKCTVNAGELLGELRAVQARAKIASMEILKHIRFEVTQGRVSLLGHDLDSSSETALDADDTQPGKCAIPCDPLIRLVGGLPKSAGIMFDLDGRQVTIKSGRSRYKLPVLDPVDFPEALSAADGLRFIVTKDDLEQLFARPRAALDPKDQRLVSQGVFLHDEQGKLCSAGYATHNLMRFSSAVECDGFAGTIVPRSSIDEILRVGEGELCISPRAISISQGVRTYCSKLIDAKFPDGYRKVIPESAGAFIEVDRDEFMECLARLAALGDFANEPLIDLTIGADEITACITSLADGAESLECEVSGAAGKFFCIKATQLLDACKAMNGEKVRIFLRGEMDPVRIVDPSEPSAINVQMPCLSKNRKAEAA